MKYVIEKLPMPGSADCMGPKQRAEAVQALGPDECITLDLTNEERVEAVRMSWMMAVSRIGVKVRTRLSREPDGRVLLRIWRVSEDQ
jgi:hypothetical protein